MAHLPIDPESLAALVAFQRATETDGPPPSIQERRGALNAIEAEMASSVLVPADVRIEERRVPGPAGAPEVLVRIYRPSVEGPAPGIFAIHGGGMCFGSCDANHGQSVAFCASLGAVVVSVQYRLAPEHPYPAAPEDCYAALTWMAAHTDELGVDPERIAIYGESAGGGLTIATALMARDRGGPKLSYMMAIYPMIDDRNETPSSHEIVGVGLWDRDTNAMGWAAYLGGQPADGYAAPTRCEDLSGLPPTYIDVGTVDLFRDEDLAFASRLVASGVPVEFHLIPGAYHGSETVAPDAALSKRIIARRMEAMGRALHPTRP